MMTFFGFASHARRRAGQGLSWHDRRLSRELFAVLAGSLLASACASAGQPGELGRYDPVAVRVSPAPLCYSCFWRHQPAELQRNVITVLGNRTSPDPLQRAELKLIVARVSADSAAACAARTEFERLAGTESHPRRRLLAQETAAFMASECGAERTSQFQRAADAARAAGEPWKADVYAQLATGTFHPLWAPTRIARRPAPPRNTARYVLGASAIRIDTAHTAVTQIERIARDWLSYQLSYEFRDGISPDAILDYHEGSRVRQLLEMAPLQVLPAGGVLAIQVGNHWYAADGEGVFRFAVLPDKLQYPTTRAWNGVALLVDTHGIASLVEPARRLHAQLVIGCGDDIGKMEAAFHLAARGVDVYYPTDDYAADVLGYDAPGVLLGSAPVRHENGSTIIGDRPVTFSVSEPIVVQSANTLRAGPLRYYHAPAKYFSRLAELLPLQLELVDVDAAGQAGRIIERARQRGARAVALRVWNEEDYAPVRAWLAASRQHRAVLLHSVVYPPGARLFEEFPGQTTFADAHPRYLSSAANH